MADVKRRDRLMDDYPYVFDDPAVAMSFCDSVDVIRAAGRSGDVVAYNQGVRTMYAAAERGCTGGKPHEMKLEPTMVSKYRFSEHVWHEFYVASSGVEPLRERLLSIALGTPELLSKESMSMMTKGPLTTMRDMRFMEFMDADRMARFAKSDVYGMYQAAIETDNFAELRMDACDAELRTVSAYDPLGREKVRETCREDIRAEAVRLGFMTEDESRAFKSTADTEGFYTAKQLDAAYGADTALVKSVVVKDSTVPDFAKRGEMTVKIGDKTEWVSFAIDSEDQVENLHKNARGQDIGNVRLTGPVQLFVGHGDAARSYEMLPRDIVAAHDASFDRSKRPSVRREIDTSGIQDGKESEKGVGLEW